MIDYNSTTQIKEVLEIFSLAMQKKFGQNFLIDQNVREKILNALDYKFETVCWEIGPGIGALTHVLYHKIKTLKVFEIDRGFINFLKHDFDGIDIVEGDFVKTYKKTILTNSKPDRIIGNLPYCAAAAIISTIIESNTIIEKMVFTVQKEVAQRASAKIGSKNYSSWTLLCGLDYDVKIIGDIGKNSFFPQPEVTSSIITMTPHGKYVDVNRELYFKLIRVLFSSRRKTIKNNIQNATNLSPYSCEDILKSFEDEGIKITDRGETLSVEKLVKVVRNISNN